MLHLYRVARRICEPLRPLHGHRHAKGSLREHHISTTLLPRAASWNSEAGCQPLKVQIVLLLSSGPRKREVLTRVHRALLWSQMALLHTYAAKREAYDKQHPVLCPQAVYSRERPTVGDLNLPGVVYLICT